MKLLKLTLLFAMLGFAAPMITACDQQEGPMEEMGESIDEAVEDIDDNVQ